MKKPTVMITIISIILGAYGSVQAAEAESTSLSCASLDQKIKLVSRLHESSPQIRLSINQRNYQYNDGDALKVLQFTNGETIVREWNTGHAVLTFKEVPLTKSDRGSEKKIAISQSEHFVGGKGVVTPAPILLQCQVIVSKARDSQFFAQAD